MITRTEYEALAARLRSAFDKSVLSSSPSLAGFADELYRLWEDTQVQPAGSAPWYLGDRTGRWRFDSKLEEETGVQL